MNVLMQRLNSAWRLAQVRYLGDYFGHIVVNEFPKSGGTWISQMLARGLGVSFPRNRLLGIRPAVLHGHYLHISERQKRVVVWRDGRDVIVSWYFHCLFPNERSNHLLVQQVRRDLMFSDYHDIIGNLPAFIEYSFTRAHHPRFTWAEFVRRWHDDNKSVFVRYEDFRHDAGTALMRLLRTLSGHDIDESSAAEIAAEFSFERLAGRKIGVEHRSSFMRKGIVGDWRNHFGEEARRTFAKHAGAELVLLGYEPDLSWVETLNPAALEPPVEL